MRLCGLREIYGEIVWVEGNETIGDIVCVDGGRGWMVALAGCGKKREINVETVYLLGGAWEIKILKS